MHFQQHPFYADRVLQYWFNLISKLTFGIQLDFHFRFDSNFFYFLSDSHSDMMIKDIFLIYLRSSVL